MSKWTAKDVNGVFFEAEHVNFWTRVEQGKLALASELHPRPDRSAAQWAALTMAFCGVAQELKSSPVICLRNVYAGFAA